MDQMDTSGCTVACPSSLQSAVEINLGAELRKDQLAAQSTGIPLSLKLQPGETFGDAQATIHIGSRRHELKAHTLENTTEISRRLDAAANGGAVAADISTTPLAAQQRDVAAVTAKKQAPSPQATVPKGQSTVLDAPMTLPGARKHSSSPISSSLVSGLPPPATEGTPLGHHTANGIASQPRPYNAPLSHTESQQQEKQPTPVAPHGDGTEQPGSRRQAARTAPKRPASGDEQQQQQQKRQRIDLLPGEQKAAATAEHHGRSRSGAAVCLGTQGRHRSAAAAVDKAAVGKHKSSTAAVSTAAVGKHKSAAAAVSTAAVGKHKSAAAAVSTAAVGKHKSAAAAVSTAAVGKHKSAAAAVSTAAEGKHKSAAAAVSTAAVGKHKSAAAAVGKAALEQHKSSAAAGTATLGKCRSTGAVGRTAAPCRPPLQLDTPIVLARSRTANTSSKQQLQAKQQPPAPAPAAPGPEGKQSQGLQKVQQHVGMKRARDDTNREPPKQAAATAPASTAAASNRATSAAAATGMGSRAKARSAAAGAGRPSAKEGAEAANRLDGKALHNNQDYQHLLELDDLKGHEHPDAVPQGGAEPAAGASKMKQQGRQQGKLPSKQPLKATRTSSGKAAQAAAEKPQSAKPKSAHGKQRPPAAAAAGASKPTLQPGNLNHMATLCKSADPAHFGVAGVKRFKAAPAEQPTEQQAGPGAGLVAKTSVGPNTREQTTAEEQGIPHTDSSVSRRLVVQHPGRTNSSEQLALDRHNTPRSSPMPSLSSKPLDLGPPGYEKFVDQQPRAFAPIRSEQQYEQYWQLHQTQLATHISLELVIEASVRSVNAALARQQAAAAGSLEQQQAAFELEERRQRLKPLVEKHVKAKDTLGSELEHLRGHIGRWLARCHLRRMMAVHEVC